MPQNQRLICIKAEVYAMAGGNSGNSHQRKKRQKAEERLANEVVKMLSPRLEGKSLVSGDVDAANVAPRILNRSSIEAYVFFILGGGYAALTAFGVSINFLAGVILSVAVLFCAVHLLWRSPWTATWNSPSKLGGTVIVLVGTLFLIDRGYLLTHHPQEASTPTWGEDSLENFFRKRGLLPQPIKSLNNESSDAANPTSKPSVNQNVMHSIPGFVLLQITPYVSNALKDFAHNEWYSADHEMELKSWADYEFEQRRHNGDPGAPLPERTQREWEEQRKETDAEYRSQFVQLLVVADLLRDALFSKLPLEAQTAHDRAQVDGFKKARKDAASLDTTGMNCCPASTTDTVKYLDDLSSRVARIQTLRPSS